MLHNVFRYMPLDSREASGKARRTGISQKTCLFVIQTPFCAYGIMGSF